MKAIKNNVMGLYVNEEKKQIIITEELDRKIRADEISEAEMITVYRTLKKYHNYEHVLLHLVWLDNID